MKHSFHRVPAEIQSAIKKLGKNIRVARIRRGIPLSEMASKVGITRKTMMEIEQGKPGSALASYATALWVLGLHDPLNRIADPDADEHGKLLESARHPQRVHRRSSARANEYDF
jgi:DNA-binding XRE family transcriptional regulator